MGGIKINLQYDINHSVSDYVFIINAVEHENNTLKDMRLKKGDTVTFDLGYCNYETFGNFFENGVLFVTLNCANTMARISRTLCQG